MASLGFVCGQAGQGDVFGPPRSGGRNVSNVGEETGIARIGDGRRTPGGVAEKLTAGRRWREVGGWRWSFNGVMSQRDGCPPAPGCQRKIR